VIAIAIVDAHVPSVEKLEIYRIIGHTYLTERGPKGRGAQVEVVIATPGGT